MPLGLLGAVGLHDLGFTVFRGSGADVLFTGFRDLDVKDILGSADREHKR